MKIIKNKIFLSLFGLSLLIAPFAEINKSSEPVSNIVSVNAVDVNSKYGCLDSCSGKSGYFYLQGWVYNTYHAVSGSKRYILLEYPQEAYQELRMREGESAVTQLNAMRFGGNIPIKSGTYQVVIDIRESGSWCRFVANTTVTVSKPTATLDMQGGSGGTTSVSVDYKTANPSITVPTRTGYTFQGYYTGTNGTGTKYYTAAGKSANNWAEVGSKTLYAYWTAKNYTLTAYANNGSISSTTDWTGTGTSATKSVAYDSSYGTLPNVSRTGYSLKGWYTASTGGTKISTSTKMQSTSGSKIYAQWNANTYTVVYNGNNNTGGSTSSSSHTYDTSKALTTNGFTRTGYTFAGWATTENGSVVYTNGQSVKNLTSTNNGTVNLYAKWTANSYSITYKDKGNLNFSGAHESGVPTTHTYGTSTTLKGATKTGYVFDGWYTTSDCTSGLVSSLGATSYTCNIVLYGKWTPITYTITYKDKDDADFSGTHNTGYPTTHTFGTATSLKNANKDDNIFLGWYTSQTCTGSPVSSLDASSYTSNITLYAKWVSVETSSIGGWCNNSGKKGLVAFGIVYSDYASLSDTDKFGFCVYSSMQGGIPSTTLESAKISDLKTNEGRFYFYKTCDDNVTYYAKAFIKIGDNTYYSNMLTATSDMSGTQYTLPAA